VPSVRDAALDERRQLLDNIMHQAQIEDSARLKGQQNCISEFSMRSMTKSSSDLSAGKRWYCSENSCISWMPSSIMFAVEDFKPFRGEITVAKKLRFLGA